MAYNASIQAKWDWENALSLAEERAAERERVKAAELRDQERAKANKEIQMLKAKAEGQVA